MKIHMLILLHIYCRALKDEYTHGQLPENLKLGKKNNNISIKILKEKDGNAIRNIIEKIADNRSNTGAQLFILYVFIYFNVLLC